MMYMVGLSVYKNDYARFGLFALPYFPGNDTYSNICNRLIPDYDMFSINFIHKITQEEFNLFIEDSKNTENIKKVIISNEDNVDVISNTPSNTKEHLKEHELSKDYIIIQFLPEPFIKQNKDGLPAIYGKQEAIDEVLKSKLPAMKINLPPLKERE